MLVAFMPRAEIDPMPQTERILVDQETSLLAWFFCMYHKSRPPAVPVQVNQVTVRIKQLKLAQ